MTTLELVSELALSNGVPVVPSTVIAERFGKQHKNVLRDIRKLLKDLPSEFTELNFKQCFKINELANGKKEPYYTLTRDAFSLLVMGFTGPEAMRWKLNFITAFNGLERLALEARQREHDERLRLEARQEAVMDAMGLEGWELRKLLGVSQKTIRRTLRKLGAQLQEGV